jgi:glycosyltransferase involved in cell wall biosynthesis
MKVVQFQRLPNASNHSIERVFASVRSASIGADVEVKVCRFESRGVFKRLYNIVDAALGQGDINHITGDVHYLALLLRKSRTVLTIHDCRGMLWESGIRRLLYHLMWLMVPVSRAGVISVISEQTKREVLRYTSCPEAKIRVIPDPVGSEFQPTPKRFRSDRPTILQIGSGRNKNIERLAVAISGLNCKLDVIGPLTANAQLQLVQADVEFEWAADLSDSEVTAKYRNADLITFCSTYEGFGMPIIEANAIGRPVVTSSIEPMASVAGGAACLVDPYDPISIRAGILRVIEDRHYREELVRLGFENAKRFSAEAVAQSYMDVYRELGFPRSEPERHGFGNA